MLTLMAYGRLVSLEPFQSPRPWNLDKGTVEPFQDKVAWIKLTSYNKTLWNREIKTTTQGWSMWQCCVLQQNFISKECDLRRFHHSATGKVYLSRTSICLALSVWRKWGGGGFKKKEKKRTWQNGSTSRTSSVLILKSLHSQEAGRVAKTPNVCAGMISSERRAHVDITGS